MWHTFSPRRKSPKQERTWFPPCWEPAQQRWVRRPTTCSLQLNDSVRCVKADSMVYFVEVPTTPLEVYFPVLVQALMGVALVIGLVGASSLLGRMLKNKVKDSPYECGMAPTGDAEGRFSVKFYLVAMLFILFAIKAVFLYPWVVEYRDLGMVAFAEMAIFVILMLPASTTYGRRASSTGP